MNKKIVAALVAVFVTVPLTAQANIKNRTTLLPSLAVIDTAINSAQAELKGKVIYEVCFTHKATCPNKQNFMEGSGAAALPLNLISKNGFDHGTQMVSAAISANPDMNIVFIRIVGTKPNGTREIVPTDLIANAINWAVSNSSKYNIKAISMSQGHHNLGVAGSDYCPKNAPAVTDAVNSASARDLPVFFATGNNWDSARIDWPSCIPGSIAVAGLDKDGYIGGWSNFDTNLVDFVDLGDFNVTSPNGSTVRMVGTSLSTQFAAAKWIRVSSFKSNLTYSQIYELLAKTSTSTRGVKVTTNRVINIQGALNG
jgi:hypothetical protein